MTKPLSTLLILAMLSCSGCSLLAGQALKKITGSSDKGITATANIGDNKKQAEITGQKISQGDNTGNQAGSDLTKYDKVDSITNNNRGDWYWIATMAAFAFLFGWMLEPPLFILKRKRKRVILEREIAQEIDNKTGIK